MFAKLLALFIIVPIIEISILVALGDTITWTVTIGIILVTGVLGAALTKRQGFQTLNKYQSKMSEGQLPHAEILEGLMILVAGALLLTPGFLTDIVGFSILVPGIRSKVRKLIATKLGNRIQVVTPVGTVGNARGNPKERVIEADVVDD